MQRGVYKELADTIHQERAHFLASSALYEAAYQKVRKGHHALLVEDTTCRKVYSDDFTKYGEHSKSNHLQYMSYRDLLAYVGIVSF